MDFKELFAESLAERSKIVKISNSFGSIDFYRSKCNFILKKDFETDHYVPHQQFSKRP